MRITGELVEATTGQQIWNHRFDGTLGDIFDMQDQVAAGVAGGDRTKAAPCGDRARKPKANGQSRCLRSLSAGMGARDEENPRRNGRVGSASPSGLNLDPAYAPAMARLAICQMMRRNRHWIPNEGPELDEGISIARLAIANARDDALVLDLAGLVLSNLAGDNDAAVSAIERAIELNPNFATAFGHHGLVLAFLIGPRKRSFRCSGQFG